MESEKVKEIKELIDCDKKQNELGGIIVVNRQFLIEVIALINELESKNARIKQSAKNLAFVNEKVIEENKKLKERKEKEIIERFVKAVYKELYQLGRIYALPETFDADKYGLFSITQEVIARIAKEQFGVEFKE